MNNIFWKRYPTLRDLHCVEMKDRVQSKVMAETREATPEALVSYFHAASRRFWRQVGGAYPESVATPMTVHETTDPYRSRKRSKPLG